MSVHRQTGPRNSDRVELSDEDEVRWWCKVLGVTEEKVRQAVQDVGTDATKIREYVRK